MFKPAKQKHRDLITGKLAGFIADPECQMWVLCGQNFQKADLPRILTKLEYIQVQTLISTNNNRQAIISQISVVCWTELRVLNLSFNNINTLEPISTLQAQRLVSLFLDNNRIVGLRSLNKANFPLLTHLSLQNNKIRQLDVLDLSNFPLRYLNIKGNCQIVEAGGLIKQNFSLEIKNLELPFLINVYRIKWFAAYGRKNSPADDIP